MEGGPVLENGGAQAPPPPERRKFKIRSTKFKRNPNFQMSKFFKQDFVLKI
jgi:hypothetical protein